MRCLFAAAAIAVLLPCSAAAQIRVVPDVDFVAGEEYPDKKDRLDIYVPERANRAPVIVSFYGGALRAGDKSSPGQVNVGRHFAAAGYVTVIANYRLSPAVMHPAHVQDAAAAVAWVKKNIAKHNGDPDRVFVIGHSAGAYLAALLAMDPRYLAAHGLKPSDVRGYVPVSAFFYVDRPGVAPDRPKDVWGIDAAVWKAASPATYVAAGAPPMLLLYADGDDAWRRGQQTEFANALGAKGNRDVEFRMITGRTHNTIWSEMAAGDDDTSRAILQFVTRLARPDSRDLQAAAPATCPVTAPEGAAFVPPAPYPSSAHASSFYFGTPRLWTMLHRTGTWNGLPRNERGLRQKVVWWRPGFDGRTEPQPALTVRGRRLDGAGSFVAGPATNAHSPDFGGWAMMTGVDVPSAGCWELTGDYAGDSLSFVVRVSD